MNLGGGDRDADARDSEPRDREDLARGIALLVAAVALVSLAPQTSDMAEVTSWGGGNVPFPYPVLAELTYRILHTIAPTEQGIAILNGLVQATFALGLYFWLRSRGPGRTTGIDARIWIAAPILLLVGQNLDAMTACFIAAGIWEWRKGRYELAGVLLGLGTAFRISPTVAILPLAAASGRRGGLRLLGSAAGAWLAVNVPYALIDHARWWRPYSFASSRSDFNGTIWAALPVGDHARSLASMPPVVALTGVVVALVLRHRVSAELGVALAMIAFLVGGKVWQPHYILWLLPTLLFVPRVPMRWLRALELASLAYFVVLWRHIDMAHPGPWLWLTAGSRLAAMVGLTVLLLRRRAATGDATPSRTAVTSTA